MEYLQSWLLLFEDMEKICRSKKKKNKRNWRRMVEIRGKVKESKQLKNKFKMRKIFRKRDEKGEEMNEKDERIIEKKSVLNIKLK